MWSYEAAAAWYLKNGTNQTLRGLVSKGYSAFAEKMLKKEVPESAVELMPIIQEIITEVKTQNKNLPPEIVALEKEWKKCYAEAAYWHSRLKDLKQPERGEKCFLILSLFKDKIHPIWDKLDYYKQFGKMPEKEKDIAVELSDKADLMKELLRIRVKITRAKKKGHVEDLTNFESTKKEIEKKLSQL
jgi:hypothetical protein